MKEEPTGPLPEDGPASQARMCCATCQPAPWRPRSRPAGTRTSSKKVSQNSSTPAMVSSGRTVMPGLFMSTKNALMPFEPLPGPSERASTMQRAAWWAQLVQSFWPRMTHSSPSRSAVVRSEPRSLPASGSENPWHQLSSPRSIGGTTSAASAGAACSMTAGPRTSVIEKAALCTNPRPVSSSPRTARKRGLPPRPPTASGHPQRIHPSSKRSR